jgi:hypothetical protein
VDSFLFFSFEFGMLLDLLSYIIANNSFQVSSPKSAATQASRMSGVDQNLTVPALAIEVVAFVVALCQLFQQ